MDKGNTTRADSYIYLYGPTRDRGIEGSVETSGHFSKCTVRFDRVLNERVTIYQTDTVEVCVEGSDISMVLSGRYVGRLFVAERAR